MILLISRFAGTRNDSPAVERQSERQPHCTEAGQASVLLILMLGTFLLASLAFAVDLSGMWFHRQSAQSAADSACLAGAADMLAVAGGVTPPSAGFTIGTASDCTATSGASICKYANFNGFDGAGLSSTKVSNSVSWTFPSSVTNVTAPTGTKDPFLRVLVTENVKTFFMGLLGRNYQQVAAACTCGIVSVKSAPPLIILNPTASGTLSSGHGGINIVGGPSRSIQVNSTDATAVSASGVIDTSAAGPDGTGGDIGVVGGPASTPAGWPLGATGKWVNPTLPIPDPYAAVPAPTKPAPPTFPNGLPVLAPTDGCLSACLEYSPGYYPTGISVGANTTAIFKAGIYWMDGDLSGGGNSTLRNAYLYVTTPQLDGVMFYFNHGSVQISGNSGSSTSIPISSDALKCSASNPTPSGVPALVNGNILWSQCVSGGTYFGPGSSDASSSSGTRGLLVFNAKSNSSMSGIGGNGKLLFSGALYSHNDANNATWDFSGNGSNNSYLVGNIVTDKLAVSGNGSILLSLNRTLRSMFLKSQFCSDRLYNRRIR